MSRVLLVEDDIERINWFRAHCDQEIHHVSHPDVAVQSLESMKFDELWLDHDLGTEPQAGGDVATWLAAHPENNPDIYTRVHSVNVVSGPKIVARLRAVGRICEWIPFPRLAARI